MFDYSYNNGEATGTYHVYCNNANVNDVALSHPGDSGLLSPSPASAVSGANGAEVSGTMTTHQAQAALLTTATSHDLDARHGVPHILCISSRNPP